MKTRTYLFLMAAAILGPVALAFWLGVSMLLDWERESRIQRVQETARATALLVDREIAVKEALLKTIANSESLGEQNYPRVYRLAARLNSADSLSWTTLVDHQTRPIFNTLTPYGTRLPPSSRNYAEEVLRTGRTRVSGYFHGPLAKRAVVSVDVPSPPGAAERYVVSQIFDARYFERVFANNALQPSWLVGIFDADGVTIARNRPATHSAGKPMHGEMRSAAKHAGSGVLRHTTHEGVEVYGVYTRAAVSGWTIVIGVPVAEIESAARTAALYATLALAIVMGLAVLLAVFLGNKLSAALQQAGSVANSLARGAIATPRPTKVDEVDALLDGLHYTSEALARESAARQSLQHEREQLLVSEQRARRVAEAQSRAKDSFLAMLGHELRNPLAAISGAMSVLEIPNLTPERAASAREISRRQMRHLTRIVDDLLDVQRILSGKIVLQHAPVNLGEVLRACADAKRLVDAGNHHWDIALEPAWVDGDRTRLEQIVDNLLHNAIKYTPAGGSIAVRCQVVGSEVLVEVRDSGVGIAPELLPVIFDVLVQGPTSIDRAQGGLGLGLALVKELTALHGGRVSVHSAGHGQGCSFTLVFPLATAATRQGAPGLDTVAQAGA
ncbi:sensor histidine kinase [Massilia yuzhufengensis]|uniref:histidine kinase n=1 Tax=Massilia yuzhufengensis TaxID=1164594 RepID=A0A1I1R1T6_9BURK|nr:sensor histidine kinase [Massilia yuzhufengensis]SFD26078.1 Signal transduction histidine kinase [Massilia yuzhufengensis]